jgi:hypothetical protein
MGAGPRDLCINVMVQRKGANRHNIPSDSQHRHPLYQSRLAVRYTPDPTGCGQPVTALGHGLAV